LQDKSEAKGVVKKFIRRVQNEFELKVKNIRSDMALNLGTLKLKSSSMKKTSSMNYPLHTLLNKMTL
jgi:hypothetical protein